MSRSRAAAFMTGVALVASAVLSGCVTVTASPQPSSSASTPASETPDASPTPTQSAPMAAFETIDGTWCPADGGADCMTIALPYVEYEGVRGSTVAAATVGADSAPCYSTFLSDIESGVGEVALFYCPKGVTVERSVVTAHDNADFDRVYLTQNPPHVDTYFRQDDLDQALHR